MPKSTIKLNRGMNNAGNSPCFYCQNVTPAREDGVYFGTGQILSSYKNKDNLSTWLDYIYGFCQTGNFSSAQTAVSIFGKTKNGDMYLTNFSLSTFIKCNAYSRTNSISRGIALDPFGNVIYTGDRYLGRAIKKTLAADLAAGGSTITLSDITSLPASGYGLIKDTNTENSEVIQWTGISSPTLTGVTRAKYYTTDRAHATGCEFYYFDDSWKDLGASITTSTREICTLEDMVFIANGSYVARYALADGSDYDAQWLTLPSGYDVVSFGKITEGTNTYLLVGANKGEDGAIFVFQGDKDEWIRMIECDNISRIHKTYVGTDSGLFQTNGVSIEKIWQKTDDVNKFVSSESVFRDIKDKGDFLYFSVSGSSFNRNKPGLYVMNKNNGDYFYISSPYNIYDDIIYSIHIASEANIITSGNFNGGCINSLNSYANKNGNILRVLFAPVNANKIKLKSIKVNQSIDTSSQFSTDYQFSYKLALRYHTFKEPLIKGYMQLKSGETAGVVKNVFYTDRNIATPSVRDCVQIIQRNNSASSNCTLQPRTISTFVNDSVGNRYIITVDRDFEEAADQDIHNDVS